MDYDKLNKKQLTEKCRDILSKKPRVLGKRDTVFVRWLYSRRFEDSESIKKFSVGVTNIKGCKNYNAFQADGNIFSYIKCINCDPLKIMKRRVLEAARCAIYNQIAPLRKKGMHVDHIIPFHVLFSDWIIENDLTLEDIKTKDGYCSSEMEDKELESSWSTFHKENAKLRVITAKENMRKGATEDLALYRYRRSRGETYDRVKI